jgi:hypothetical protein
VKTPEQRARKWLRLYPRAYREHRGDELLATLFDKARDDPRIPIREIPAVIVHAGSMRIRQSRIVTVIVCVAMLCGLGAAIGWLSGPDGHASTMTVSPLSAHAALVAHDTYVLEHDQSWAAAHDTGSAACPVRENPDGCWVPPPGYISAPKVKNAPFVPIPVPSLPSSRPSPQPAGTIGNMISPVFSLSQYTVVNSWLTTNRFHPNVVFAGALGRNPKQGVVVVVSCDGTVENPHSVKAYPTPAKDGALRLTATQGLDLTLTAADGTIYHFNASTDQYL